MTTPSPERVRPVANMATARLVSGILVVLGLLGVLRTGTGGPENLFMFRIHPLTGFVWLALGLAGVAAAVAPARATRYLRATAAVLILWTVVGLALDGGGSALFSADADLAALHLALAAVALAPGLIPASWTRRTAPD